MSSRPSEGIRTEIEMGFGFGMGGANGEDPPMVANFSKAERLT
jgi:hypothetical protein